MTSRDFVIWLRGFTEACNDYTATPKQWDRIKEVLDDVEDTTVDSLSAAPEDGVAKFMSKRRMGYL